MTTQQWRKILKLLRKKFPIKGEIKILRHPIRADNGYTTFRQTLCRRIFYIHINSTVNFQNQWDTLVHEWSHVIAIEQACDHDGIWGAVHGKVYESCIKEEI